MKRWLIPILICALCPLSAQDPAAKPQLPFSKVRKAGNTLYISGQVPRTPDGRDITGSVADQTRQVMDNIGAILKANGYGFEHVVKASVFLADLGDYAEMNRAYATYFKDAFPARECVGGLEIVRGFKVEISCIAYKE